MIKITREFLRSHSKVIFVFGDNLLHKGHGGAAELRDEANTYGFITKKYPNNRDSSFYTPDEYREVFAIQIHQLIEVIKLNPHKLFLISKIGSGLANRHGIWEKVIEPQIFNALKGFTNVLFLWLNGLSCVNLGKHQKRTRK